jgi:uncharacterized protein
MGREVRAFCRRPRIGLGMIGRYKISRCLVGAALLAAVDFAGVTAIDVVLTSPAQAQFFGNDFFGQRQRQRSGGGGGGFFGGFFGGGDRYENPEQQAPVDNSRAPPPRKPDAKAEPVTPATTVVVLGDAMADWLGYGLEDAFSDSPEISVVRKNKLHSGLVRYEAKSDLDWWRVARDILTQEKANYVVMMMGVSDRTSIRERDLAKDADKKKGKEQAEKPAAEKNAQNKEQADEQEQTPAAQPESQPVKKTGGTVEFRTDQWAEIYSKRIDDTIAAMKSKGVPVLWVGLPSIRGGKSTADAVYLNDLYRARAERAGIVYIDIWDGFVDEAGKYSNFGPDYEGQMRRLRSADGVFFTKAGALKLAHYVEREIRRHMNSRATPIALPTGPLTPAAPDGKPAARPVAGPVVPLTVAPGNTDELLGGAGNSSPHGDAIATRVLVKGEPLPAPAGRADDFMLQRSNDEPVPPAAAGPAAGALASAPEPLRIESTPEQRPGASQSGSKPTQGAQPQTQTQTAQTATQGAKPKPQPQRTQHRDDVPRPPRGIFPSGGSPFGLFRF